VLSASSRDIPNSLLLACDSRQSPYDCSYLALALEFGCDLYTADEKFRSAAARTYLVSRISRNTPE
jgi:predicted nucleic acid-binding protein